MFLPKSTHVGGWHPPTARCPPQREILDLPLFCNARLSASTHVTGDLAVVDTGFPMGECGPIGGDMDP